MTRTLHTATFGVLALVLSAAFALPLHAQDRSNDQRDQPTQDHPAAPPGNERRGPQDETRQGATDENRRAAPDENHRAAPDENHRAAPDEDRRAGPDDARRAGGDDVDGLRHAHPRASARCHDGFFTTTRERTRACTKHGGIDIWLEL